ncbi:MAG TPA: nuclear transport factor 2 family protein [Blastocatellia bacterium]|nr:nuclear transport factor 2 family protein [Blastocatellia bacterium]
MSQENIDIIRGMYDAFARGDIPAVLGVFDPDIQWYEAENFLYADRNPYIGPTAVLEGVFARLGSEWEGFSATPESLLDAGNAVVTQGHYTGVYKSTGKSVRAQFAHVLTMRGGKVIRFQQYTDTKQFAGAAAT